MIPMTAATVPAGLFCGLTGGREGGRLVGGGEAGRLGAAGPGDGRATAGGR